ncbi:MAG TPA: phospholipase D-like domain-containing protein, partial [Ilumatobacteraceae bacterium]
GEIERAERTVDLLTFVYWSGEIGDRFASALADRANQGVRVRVLLDAVGTKPMDPDLVARMTSAGCDVRRFRPPDLVHPLRSGHRTHRKILVCDEQVGFTGGVGIADEWRGDGRHSGQWRDTHVRVQGRAVDGLRAAFLDNWTETDLALFDTEFDHWPQLAEDGPSAVQVVQGSAEPGWNAVSTTVRALMDLAHEQLRVTTAYFVPDDDLMQRFRQAAERGVHVQVLVPGPEADKRFVQVASEACYGELLDLGIEVHCYQPSMLHAKVLTVDGAVATVGSANFNNRSRSLDEEVNLVIFDPEVVAELDHDFDRDLEHSVALDLSRWKDRSVVQRGLERVIRVAEPWM